MWDFNWYNCVGRERKTRDSFVIIPIMQKCTNCFTYYSSLFLIKILLNVYHLSCKFISSDIWWRTCRNQMKLFLNGVEIYLWPRFVQIELFACYIFFTGSKKVYSEIAWLCILFICALIFSLYFLVMLFIFAVGTPGCVVRQTHSWRHF